LDSPLKRDSWVHFLEFPTENAYYHTFSVLEKVHESHINSGESVLCMCVEVGIKIRICERDMRPDVYKSSWSSFTAEVEYCQHLMIKDIWTYSGTLLGMDKKEKIWVDLFGRSETESNSGHFIKNIRFFCYTEF